MLQRLLIAVAVWTCSMTAFARAPEMRVINLRGLQIGQPTTLTIDGADLQPAPKVMLNGQVLDVVVDPQSTTTRLVMTATVPNDVVPGVALLRLATVEGVSNSILVGLDRLPQKLITEKIDVLPVALHGSVPGSGVSKTSFVGKAGDEILIEVEAKRLGSKLRPVIHLFDEQRLQIAWSGPSRSLGGDARVHAKLLRAGTYAVEVHDAQYAAPGGSFFRLKMGHWQYADLTFPAAVTKGQEASLELLGNTPGAKLTFKAPAGSDVVPAPWHAPQSASGIPPAVLISALPEILEANTAEPMPLTTIPVAVNGRLDQPGQLDRFQLPVTAGAKLSFEVFAERLGSRIDAVLELRNKQGGVVASNDDQPNSIDPRLEFTVPAGLDLVELVLRDALEIADSHAIYRLVIAVGDAVASPVEVTAKSDVSNIASGERQVLEIRVVRRGYNGPLQLVVGQLPAGITLSGTEIPAGANGTLLTLTNTGDAPAQSITTLQAKSPDGAIVVPVRIEQGVDDRLAAWLREQLAIAALPKVAQPIAIEWADEPPLTQLVLATKKPLPVKFIRPSGALGPLRLTLVTSQEAPRVNNQPNPNLTLRGEKVVEVSVDAPVTAAINALTALDKQLADAAKLAATAQGDAKTAADANVVNLTQKKSAAEAAVKDAEAKANAKSELALIVPAQLSDSFCDIAVKCELLNPERNTALRTVYSPVRRLPKLNPLVIKLDAPATIEAMLDAKTGATLKVTGKLERLNEQKGDVTFTVTGLPAGVSATPAVIKDGQADFSLEIRVPANFAQAEITGMKLLATGPADPLSGNLQVRNEVDLVVKLQVPAIGK